MPLIGRLNPLVGLIVGVTLGGVVGLILDNFSLWLVIGASVGLLVGRFCSNRSGKRMAPDPSPMP